MANDIRIDLKLTGEHATARGLRNVGDAAEDAGDDLQKLARDANLLGTVGARSAAKFGQDFTGSLMALRGPGIAAAVGLGAAMAPLIGASVSAAVLGGVGVGGLVGGIAAAAQDARVKDAATDLGEHMAQAFTKSGKSFIAPTIEALHILDAAGERTAGSLAKAFSQIAPTLVPLTRGLVGMVDEIMPGLTKAMDAAKPIIRALANELPELGDAISDFFESISEDTDGAVAALVTLMKVAGGSIRAVGGVLQATEQMFEGIIRAAGKIAPIMENLWGWIPGTGDMIKGARQQIDETIAAMDKAKNSSGDFAGSLGGLARSAREAHQRMLQLNDVMNEFFGIAMDSEKATIAYERSWDEMVETLSKGKRTLDATTEAGRRNREAIDANIESILAQHQARIAEGQTMEQSLPIYDQQLERIRRQAIALGYNKDQVNELINVYHLVPEMASTTVEAPGLEQTLQQARELARLIRTLSGATIGAVAGARVRGYASGGDFRAGEAFVAGEGGRPELVVAGSTGGHVYNGAQTAAVMSGASWGVAPQPPTIVFQTDGTRMGDMLLEMIREFVRVKGRGDVQVAFGR